MLKYILMPAAIMVASQAASQTMEDQTCRPRESIVELLNVNWGETQQTMAISGEVMMEQFANLETGTWTIVATLGNGMSCLLASGREFLIVSQGDPA